MEICPATLGSPQRRIERRKVPPRNGPRIVGDFPLNQCQRPPKLLDPRPGHLRLGTQSGVHDGEQSVQRGRGEDRLLEGLQDFPLDGFPGKQGGVVGT